MNALIGMALLYAGYSIGYYGFNRITGGNDTFKSLFWPGSYKPTTRDGGAGGSAAPPGLGAEVGGAVGGGIGAKIGSAIENLLP